ncbi:hypothetical protein T4A_2047 [Trichinella pseudospiralis]|uniref:Uncharacterized protein n=1 Tax=Trichinella pseudospiralis TaxID=6337 RepID=A0A0V0YKG8_TRIPS|nr:hypothetical protein T4E_3351 [Trichinella pseudospiralis]KRY67083.1 hypothetical protein T4A_2047 [Trichinella pseudospiralis]KRZ30304.1 hypothetical protein T4C_9345 [Trichinella pseudospiralis]
MPSQLSQPSHGDLAVVWQVHCPCSLQKPNDISRSIKHDLLTDLSLDVLDLIGCCLLHHPNRIDLPESSQQQVEFFRRFGRAAFRCLLFASRTLRLRTAKDPAEDGLHGLRETILQVLDQLETDSSELVVRNALRALMRSM